MNGVVPVLPPAWGLKHKNKMKHEGIRSKSLLSGRAVKTAAVVLACLAAVGPSRAEIPVSQWANPVLASADAVLGPLSDAAKLASGIYTDYCKLNAYTTIQYYKSLEKSTRGTLPFESYQATIIESGVDPRNPSNLINIKTVQNRDSSGKITTTVDTSPILISKIGNVSTKCEKRNTDGSLVSRFELTIDPTLINVHVDIAKYATYSMRNPTYVYVEMSAAADIMTDCSSNDKATDWTQVTRVSPGVQNVVPFYGKNVLARTAWPRIDIGYSYTPPAK